MSGSGQIIADFGTGAADVTVSVTGQTGIAAGSLAEAWIFPVATADNTLDNHLAEDLEVIAHSPVAGVGFSIFIKCRTGRAFGKYNLGWVWN